MVPKICPPPIISNSLDIREVIAPKMSTNRVFNAQFGCVSLCFFCFFLYYNPIQAQTKAENANAGKPGYNALEWERRRKKKIADELLRDGEIRFKYASMLVANTRYAQAQELLSELSILFPDHPRQSEIGYYLAVIAEKQGYFEEAKQLYIEAYHREPTTQIALKSYLQAGRLTANLGQLEQARVILQELSHLPQAGATARLAQVELQALKFAATE